MGRPRDGLDGRDVLGVGVDRLQIAEVPHEQLVVVSAGGQVLVVRRPLQTAHLLTVTSLGAGREEEKLVFTLCLGRLMCV